MISAPRSNNKQQPSKAKPRVAAVRYLNTVPLIWGMLHGPQSDLFDLSLCLPSECADRIEQGTAEIGIVPAIELPRLELEVIPGAGIACHGPVRSILLVSKVPLPRIHTLAADAGSRSSVALARIILAEKYGAEPEIASLPPDLNRMLEVADAALIIGDPALRLDPATIPYEVRDLGGEWEKLTGKPMVFAVWAARPHNMRGEFEEIFRGSCRFGLERIGEIIQAESRARSLSERLIRHYLTRRVVFELSENDYEGLDYFLQLAARLEKRQPFRIVST